MSTLDLSTDSEVETVLNESDAEQSVNDTVVVIVLSSRRVPFCMLLNCENDFTCTATLMDEDAADYIVVTVAENNAEDGSGDAECLKDKPSKMERIGYAV